VRGFWLRDLVAVGAEIGSFALLVTSLVYLIVLVAGLNLIAKSLIK
jgi:hypothetical protein